LQLLNFKGNILPSCVMIGIVISHYRIIEKLGEGGMGIVYKAEDTKLKRIIALKFLPSGLEAHEPERARFLQEAQAASALNHQNVCTIYDIREEGDQYFIVMEYVDGKTLRQVVPIQRIQDVITYAIQIGEALHEAHSHAIVHRDVKPENIMVNTKNQIKVMDFGLAKLKGSLKLTRTSSTVGTLAYMAPEQIQGGEVDARSDIFSFGIVLFEMLTGHLPFRGEHEAAMMYSILNEEATPIQRYIPDVSSEVVHITNRALDKDPEDRYQSVHEMIIDLRRVKKKTTNVVRTSSHQAPASLTVETAAHAPEALPSHLKKRIWLIAGMGIVVVALYVLWKLLLSPEQTSRELYPLQTFKPVRIATDARAIKAALSPDGRYIIYAADESGMQSVWMRQVSAASSVRILPPEDVRYNSFTFSPDGDHVYYSAVSQNNTTGSIYVMPTLGGTPRKLSSNILGGIAVSPNGKQLAFIRGYPDQGEEALMVCSADGSNERKLVSRKGEDFFVGGGQAPAWTPDGKTIATSVGSLTGKWYMSVLLVSIVDGSSQLATSNRWNSVGAVAWASDGRGIVVVAQEYLTGTTAQLWYVDPTNGNVRRITTDLNDYDYSTLSITSNQSTLLALQQSFNSTITILPAGDWHRASPITSRNPYHEGDAVFGLDWTPDGQLVFQSLVSGNNDIWMMDADGKNRRQLTANFYDESSPSVSGDGQFLVYSSSRDTTPHVWRMDVDGNNQKPLTTGVLDDYNPRCSPDSKWIYYNSYRNQGRMNLWKVSANGGDPIKVSDDIVYNLGTSPDGRTILTRAYQPAENKWRYGILSVDDGKYLKVFDLPTIAGQGSVHWMPNGKAVGYIDTHNGVSNIWVLPLETMKAYQLTHFDSELISEFSWSKDGKNLAIVRGEQTSDVVLLTDLK
jgi:Tol biopolymer transport system component/predicted Ser/Thr protein kinase